MEAERNEKARFMAQYWGQKVMYYYSHDNNKLYQEDISHYIRIGSIKHCHLLLAPLSAITDEDAIEVVRLTYGKNLNGGISTATQSIVCCNVKTDNGSRRRYISKDNLNRRAYQYLQSKGYALPFRDKSVEQLIELGWLKLKT
jgi:hypothetical protein